MDVYIQAARRLPCCGVVLEHRVTYAPGFDSSNWFESGAQVLGFYFKDREARHQCGLVNEANPTGYAPRTKA